MRQFGQERGRPCMALCVVACGALIITAITAAHDQRTPTARADNAALHERAGARDLAPSPAFAPRSVRPRPGLHARTLSLPLALAMSDASAAQSVVVSPDNVWSQTYGPSPDPAVHGIAYAPDGQTVVTGFGDRSAQVWRAADGAPLRYFPRPGYSCGGSSVTGLAYMPDAQQLAIADGCATRLVNLTDGTLVRQFGAGGAIALSFDGQYLANTIGTSYRTRIVKLFRVSDGALLWSVTGGGRQVAFAPDGTLASIGTDGIEFWRLTDGARTRQIAGPQTALAFSPDSTLVAAAGVAGGEYPYDSTIEWYTVADGALVRKLTRTGSVGILRFTPDGQQLVAGGYEPDYNRANYYGTSTNALRIFRLSDGLISKTYDLGTDYPGLGGLALAPDGQALAYAVKTTTYLAHTPAPTQCTYTITPTSATFERTGGTGNVQVNTQPGCSWTARARNDWLAITANAAGTGPGTVTYSVAPYADSVAPGPPYYIHDVLVVAEQTFAVHQNIAPPCPCYYTINGLVQDGTCLTNIADITVTLSGGASATVQTDANGQFSFPNLPAGQSYTVTLTKDGYAFDPPSRTTGNLSADAWLSFKTTVNPHPLPYIRGHILDANGAGLYGIQLQLDGGAYPRTDYSYTNGLYAFNCLEPGHTYTLTPVSATYTFSPPSRTFDNLSAGQQGMDFVVVSNAPGQMLISEFRTRGPSGSADEFVELYNNSDQPLTISTADGSDGWALAALAADGTAAQIICTIPNGTTIPARGHYLVGNANGAAAGSLLPASLFDETYAADLADGRGLALFRTDAPAHLTLAYRLDAVGFTAQAGTAAQLFAEGACLAPVSANVASDEQYAYVRKNAAGVPQDTNDNAADFALVSTTGTVGGAPAVLGAPAPENLSSPVQRNAQLKASLIDPQQASTSAPNRVRELTPIANGAQGTLTIRRRFTNKTGQPVTALRFRIVDITTLGTPNAGGAQADLRAVNSVDVTLTTGGGNVLVKGTTLDEPAQPKGGGLNSALVVQLPGGSLANGASVNVQFVLGVNGGGSFRFLVNVEALTGASASAQKTQRFK